MDTNSYVEFKNINKHFPGVQALDNISFTAYAGEVCVLLGENGAGKSALLKVLSGAHQADGGEVEINGKKVEFTSTQEAIEAGVSVIYQERQLVRELTVTENIFMDDLPHTMFGIVSFRKAHAEAQKIIDMFQLPIRAEMRVKDLSVALQQMVEVIKAVRRNSNIIAFDEPTASLSDTEITTLFKVIQRLKREGKIILYVSHRLKELFEISEKIVIMKDGKLVDIVNTKDATEKQLIRLMVGRELGDIFDNLQRNESFGDVILETKNLKNDKIFNISFKLHAGEVLGFSGLVGAGRTEIVHTLFGIDSLTGGEIIVDGKKVNINSPTDAIKSGIGLCPEDRKEMGLVLGRPIRDNVSITILKTISKNGVISNKEERKIAAKAVKDYRIRTHSIEKKVIDLSGGNQQKVILGRWMSTKLKVLILDEPTKGIDVGAKAEIYQMVCDLARIGMGVIFTSSELPEVINICDRIIVVCDGRITGELSRSEASEEKVLELAMKTH